MAGWKSVNVDVRIVKTLDKLGFTTMTPVQAASIPVFLKNKDVVVQAVTGSGKTLAFVVPIMEMLLKKKNVTNEQVLALIISPTRELAFQIWEVVNDFTSHTNFSNCLLVGGNPVEDDIQKLKLHGSNILVATPGRMEDLLIRQKNSELSTAVKSLEMLILDEADRLLDLGFANCIDNILRFLPKQRRTGLFSATMTKELESLIRAGLRNPVAIFVKEKTGNLTKSTPCSLENYYVICEADRKTSTLLNFVQREGAGKKYIVFFPTCACVEWFYVVLKNFVTDLYSLHGKMGKHRNSTLEKFKSANSGILICTDVMARGIDVPQVHWVIQYDPPKNAESFVHRVGRTARNGRSGRSLIFLLPSEDVYVDFLRMNQNIELTRLDYDCGREPVDDTVFQTMRKLQLQDRANFDRANRAFVSYVRFYSKHECSLILKLKDVPFGRLASGFGLLKLPKMPEIPKTERVEFFAPVTDVDFNSIKYKNREKELSRRKKLGNIISKNNSFVAVPSKRKNGFKKDADSSVRKKKKKSKWSDEDFASLAKDVALISKLKKRKISKESFEKEFCRF